MTKPTSGPASRRLHLEVLPVVPLSELAQQSITPTVSARKRTEAVTNFTIVRLLGALCQAHPRNLRI